MHRALLSVFALLLTACSGASEAGGGSSALSGPTHPAFTSLAPESRQNVRQSNVHVLLFPERFAAATVATSGEAWMALSARDGDLTLSLHATSVVHHDLAEISPGETVPAPAYEVRGVPARSGINEGIRFVTWNQGDTAYSLELECFEVHADPRCAEPGLALDLADELVEIQQ